MPFRSQPMANIIEGGQNCDEIERNPANCIQRSSVNQFYAKKAKHNNVIGPWKPCVLISKKIDENIKTEKYIVKFLDDGEERPIETWNMASQAIPNHIDLKAVGTRVIAKRCSKNMPYVVDAQNRKTKILDGREDEFYAGIIARAFDNQYCVFFDDGAVQMVSRERIRRVEGNYKHEHAHWNAKSYFQFYLNTKQIEIDARVHNTIKVELNGTVVDATIRKIDRILAQIHFLDANRFEWIYLGSPRISTVYRSLILNKCLDNILEIKKFKLCLSADASVVMIDLPEQRNHTADKHVAATSSRTSDRADKRHECSHECVRAEDSINFNDSDAFQRPLLTGWTRHPRFYRTPCGLSMRSYSNIEAYLMRTKSKLRKDWFKLDKISSFHVANGFGFLQDVSGGLEKIPISVCGPDLSFMSNERSFKYGTTYNFDFIDVEFKSNLERKGCDCTDNCRDKTECSCWQLTVQRSKKRQRTEKDFKSKSFANIGYKNERLEQFIPTGIVECGANCKCCADNCVNRIVQRGLQHELELFHTEHKGWGVRTKTLLPAGVFLSNYIGCVLDGAVADNEPSTYQFRLPSESECNDDSSETDTDCDIDIEPRAKQIQATGYDVVQTLINYFPPLKDWNTNNFPDSELDVSSDDEGDYVIDSLNYGNISRFFNHSCEPNLMAQHVYVNDDTRFPLISFFTNQVIQPGAELTIDYKYDLDDERKTPCLCGAATCRKRLI